MTTYYTYETGSCDIIEWGNDMPENELTPDGEVVFTAYSHYRQVMIEEFFDAVYSGDDFPIFQSRISEINDKLRKKFEKLAYAMYKENISNPNCFIEKLKPIGDEIKKEWFLAVSHLFLEKSK